MPTPKQDIRLTVDEYLDLENKSDEKHEFVNGYIYAMVGASRTHNLIALTLASLFRAHLKGSGCRVNISDMKVSIKTQGDEIFYYPDVLVSCDSSPPGEYFEDKPLCIVEVLSDSTQSKDRLEKLSAYTKLESLQEYVLVAQHKVSLDIYRKVENTWLLNSYAEGEDVLFSSIDLTLPIIDIYEDVIGKVL